MKRLASLSLIVSVGLAPGLANADTFPAGSLVIPMDTDYQDDGMLEAFGLVYELLRNGVHIHWVIKQGKAQGDVDFTTSAVDLQTSGLIMNHGYRGGPWVITATDAAKAKPIITAWHAKFPIVNVHETTVMFDGDVAHVLVVAPNIAMFADGNQKIARKYMQAARIPDSTGDPTWPDSSPDMLSVLEVEGPTTTNHHDGALFDDKGTPVYCQFMSMHWGVGDAEKHPEVVAEVRDYLLNPVHFFAECQAVNAFENLDPHGFYLTEHGFLIGQGPNAYDFYEMDTPFGQLDGAFQSVGGSEPAYTLPPGDSYKAEDTVLITQQGTPIGVNDVWMTGFLDGICPGAEQDDWQAACLTAGKVSYLGGHEYDVALPISKNPKTQGARLFLNSLFEAPCATEEGFPTVMLAKVAPTHTTNAQVTFTLQYENVGPTSVLDVVVSDTLPMGSTFVSATDDGMLQGMTVVWNLGNLAASQIGQVSFTVDLPAFGSYENVAQIDYRVGVNGFVLDSNKTMTVYDDNVETDDTAGGTAGGTDDGTSMTASASSGATGSDSGLTVGTDGPSSTAGTDHGDTDNGEGGMGSGSGAAGGCACRTDGTDRAWLLLPMIAWATRRRRYAHVA